MIIKDNPKVDIIIANYNHAEFLPDAIDSVLNQTYSNWKLTIVDDFSSDETRKIIDFYLRKDDRVNVIYHNKNKGYGEALITGIENTNNPFIGILDSDDYLESNAVFRSLLEFQRAKGILMTYSMMQLCSDDINCPTSHFNPPDKFIIPSGKTFLDLCPKGFSFYLIQHFKVFKRKAYIKTGGIKRNLRKSVDKDIIFKMEEVGKIKFIPEILYRKRTHAKQITKLYKHKPEIMKQIMEVVNDAKRRRGII